MKLRNLSEDIDQTFIKLLDLKMEMAAAAQDVYNSYVDEALMDQGICDDIAAAMAGVITSHLNIEVSEGGHEGDDHAWLIIRDKEDNPIYGIDIQPHHYETGGGFNWILRKDVEFTPDMVDIWKY